MEANSNNTMIDTTTKNWVIFIVKAYLGCSLLKFCFLWMPFPLNFFAIGVVYHKLKGYYDRYGLDKYDFNSGYDAVKSHVVPYINGAIENGMAFSKGFSGNSKIKQTVLVKPEDISKSRVSELREIAILRLKSRFTDATVVQNLDQLRLSSDFADYRFDPFPTVHFCTEDQLCILMQVKICPKKAHHSASILKVLFESTNDFSKPTINSIQTKLLLESWEEIEF